MARPGVSTVHRIVTQFGQVIIDCLWRDCVMKNLCHASTKRDVRDKMKEMRWLQLIAAIKLGGRFWQHFNEHIFS